MHGTGSDPVTRTQQKGREPSGSRPLVFLGFLQVVWSRKKRTGRDAPNCRPFSCGDRGRSTTILNLRDTAGQLQRAEESSASRDRVSGFTTVPAATAGHVSFLMRECKSFAPKGLEETSEIVWVVVRVVLGLPASPRDRFRLRPPCFAQTAAHGSQSPRSSPRKEPHRPLVTRPRPAGFHSTTTCDLFRIAFGTAPAPGPFRPSPGAGGFVFWGARDERLQTTPSS